MLLNTTQKRPPHPTKKNGQNCHHYGQEPIFNKTVMLYSKDADGMANSIDPDQSTPDLGLHCLLRPICPISSKFNKNTCKANDMHRDNFHIDNS